MHVLSGGGGGWGDPFERDPQKVLDDVIDEYVSIESARDDYGVIIEKKDSQYVINQKETEKLRKNLDVPVSLLISPTILNKDDLVRFKESGADKIGIAVDCATPDLFEKIRGKGVKGPHKWDRYWECYQEAIEVFDIVENKDNYEIIEILTNIAKTTERTLGFNVGHNFGDYSIIADTAIIPLWHPPDFNDYYDIKELYFPFSKLTIFNDLVLIPRV